MRYEPFSLSHGYDALGLCVEVFVFRIDAVWGSWWCWPMRCFCSYYWELLTRTVVVVWAVLSNNGLSLQLLMCYVSSFWFYAQAVLAVGANDGVERGGCYGSDGFVDGTFSEEGLRIVGGPSGVTMVEGDKIDIG